MGIEQEKHSDIVIIGGGLGGTAAALAAAKAGLRVLLTEETDWLGGQLTSQAVPPDEHRWIEQSGSTASYREFRSRVRDYYRRNYPLTDVAKKDPVLNPGNGWVSRLAHEPKVALAVLHEMLAPYVNTGRIEVLYHTVPVHVETAGDRVTGVTVCEERSGELIKLRGAYYLDATECSDLLPLARVEHVSGAESRRETGEPHALDEADPLDMQSITHVAAVDYVAGGDFTIPRPRDYDYWRQYVPTFSLYPILSWYASDANDTSKLKEFTMFPNDQGITSLWDYRRIVDPTIWTESLSDGEVTLLNWALNDYYAGPIIGVSREERERHLEAARQLTLSLVYWLQTAAPRLDGGKGYPGVRLRGDVIGTEDGLAKAPYIRESRRIRGVYTITEHDVSKELRGAEGVKCYEDSVGVGSYHLDLHPTTVSQRTFYIPNHPYEIPLGALIPVRVKNLLPACKNISMTQIANGCYRLHPTEWNIGEAAGTLAAYAIAQQVEPSEVRASTEHLRAYQAQLIRQGVQLHWTDAELAGEC
ncbi:FAD-dependent oxidoreductase [Paenibacillus taichungensis]|uniref:FAD-dependent oxidoreductase n=1 Tax=Paenibacillus taichungensis TaxID=484184 RepID=A0A329QT15_9BACL|nr:FAD-dependent oxidoreductase [Paenibacillus taichungensis]RAW15241.1 FAD-dependent oxidoreductase [Paenibacillus taichungensis]